MDEPAPRASEVGWLHGALRRIRFLWVPKMVGTVVCMTVFFVGYFWLLNHPRYPVTTIPVTFIDRAIPFEPGAVVLYVSLWIYVPLAPAFLVSRRELASYGWAVTALSAAGFAVFALWPTAVPRPDVDWSLHPSLSFLKAVDASGNAFPSLHVAFAVFTAAWFERLLREMGAGRAARAANALWCVGIIYSTIAIRQHVALDALAGAALGGAVVLAHLGILRRLRLRAARA